MTHICVSECSVTKLALIWFSLFWGSLLWLMAIQFSDLMRWCDNFIVTYFYKRKTLWFSLPSHPPSKNKKILQQKRRRILFVYSGRPLTSIWFGTIGSFWRTDVGLIFFLLFFDNRVLHFWWKTMQNLDSIGSAVCYGVTKLFSWSV